MRMLTLEHRVNISKGISRLLKVKRLKFYQQCIDNILKDREKCYELSRSKTVSASIKKARCLLKPLWKFYYNKKFSRTKQALHKCNNAFCINIFHIYEGTHQDNMRDMINNETSAKGEKNGMVRLSEESVIEIRKMYETGSYTQRELAELFRVSQSTICQIVTNYTWTHLI